MSKEDLEKMEKLKAHPQEAAQIIVSALKAVAQNPNVDIVGHILRLREVPIEVLTAIPVEDWREIFRLMKENNQALEVNWKKFELSICHLNPKEREERGISEERWQRAVYEANLLKLAKEEGVKFSIGFDFHKLWQYGWGREKETVEEREKVLGRLLGLKKLETIKDLHPIGYLRHQFAHLRMLRITPEDIIETTASGFTKFLQERRAKAQPSG